MRIALGVCHGVPTYGIAARALVNDGRHGQSNAPERRGS